MSSSDVKKTGRYIEYAIIFLAIVLVVLFVFFVRQYVSLRRADVISARESWISAAVKNHGPATVSDIGFVRSWMTFDYVNKLFNIPPDYLKTSLSISDARYPKISIAEYAKDDHLDTPVFLSDVLGALHNYLTQQQ
jgi:hypothetical protein